MAQYGIALRRALFHFTFCYHSFPFPLSTRITYYISFYFSQDILFYSTFAPTISLPDTNYLSCFFLFYSFLCIWIYLFIATHQTYTLTRTPPSVFSRSISLSLRCLPLLSPYIHSSLSLCLFPILLTLCPSLTCSLPSFVTTSSRRLLCGRHGIRRHICHSLRNWVSPTRNCCQDCIFHFNLLTHLYLSPSLSLFFFLSFLSLPRSLFLSHTFSSLSLSLSDP